MRKRSLAILLTILLMLVALQTGFSLADAGNFAGDSDWGSSDWGSSDSDWGSSDWGSSDWDSDYSGGYVGLGNASPGVTVVIIVIVLIVFLVSRASKKGGKGSSPQAAAPVQAPRAASLDALLAKDPNFSKAEFLEEIANEYAQLQNAWQSKDFEPMRALMTDQLYNQFARQLQPYIDNGQTNHVDRIAVLSTQITGYAQDETNDVLKVQLATRVVDYVTDDKTGALLRGSNTKELFMTYEWTLIRSKDRATRVKDGESHVNCPNCGAPISVAHSAKCPYCETVVTLWDHDWVISAIRGISQRS